MSRIKAWREYNKEIKDTNELENYFQKRLGFKDNEYKNIMNSLPKSWQDFKTYKVLKYYPLFHLSKKELVPQSFYLKYCKK